MRQRPSQVRHKALDKAVLGEVTYNCANLTSIGVVSVTSHDDLSIDVISRYGAYRRRLFEAFRKREPIEQVQIPTGVQVAVIPSQINSPDIFKVIVERDGVTAEPIANMLKPTEMITSIGAKAVIHSGVVLYPCSAFAAGATMLITAIPESVANFTKTISSEALSKLK